MYGVVYTVKLNDVVVYVGQTTMPLEKRWAAHGQKGSGVSLIRAAIQKYGQAAFVCEMAVECVDRETLNAEERRLIAELSPRYNIMPGGEGHKGRVVSDVTRAKLSAVHKGKKLSEETKALISKKLRARLNDNPDAIAQLQAARRKWVRTRTEVSDAKRKEAARQATKQMWVERKEELSAKMRNSALADGRKPSAEALEKSIEVSRKEVRCVETGEIFKSLSAAGRAHNVTPQAIWAVVNGRTPKAGGFQFKYV